ncbi:MAG: hypothetical protein IKZ86_15555 [Spirochaetaceae bacterium]|nr:hypothetical protein [Spirochaetaceae bacterium]
MDKTTQEKIVLEISKIDTLIEKSGVLLSKCKIEIPDFIELNAIASILHSYYCGIESIFNMIYKASYGKTLTGNMWHSDLFTDMFAKTDKHNAVLPQELFVPLKEYLGFRHVFRRSYGYELDWTKLSPLFSSLSENWNLVKLNIEHFIT